MPRFIVRFMKIVLGCNGRQKEICQSCVEVDAVNEAGAAEVAKKRFCEREALKSWSVHADRIEVKAADFPS